jgi:Icc-related predicted phosphoesterase
MIIAAIGDIHSPRLFDYFVKAMEDFNVKSDLFLLAGDVINKGNIDEYLKVYNVFFGKITCPIIACFGNDEFGQETRMLIENKIPDIRFLDDETLTIEIQGKSVGIVGTVGSLDRPTYWQRNNIPDIIDVYKKRVETVEKLLSDLKADFRILLIHYPPTYKILEGEEPRIYPEIGSKDYERILTEQKPNLVITGHSHKGKKQTWIDTVPIVNVAFPLNKQIVIIDTEKDLKPGLEKFLE